MNKRKSTPETIDDAALDGVSGGGLLLPAVQAAREAARSTTKPGATNAVLGDGSVKPGDGSVKGV